MAPTRLRAAFAGRAKQRNITYRKWRMTDEKPNFLDSAVGAFLEIPNNDDWQDQLRIAKDQTAEAWRAEDEWLESNTGTDDSAVSYTDKPRFDLNSLSDADWEEEIRSAEKQTCEALEAERSSLQGEAFKQLNTGHSIDSGALNPNIPDDLSELSDSSEYKTYFDSKQSTSMSQQGGFSFGQKGTSGEQTSNLFGTAGSNNNGQNKPSFSFNTNQNQTPSTGSLFGSSNNAASSSSTTGGTPAPFGSLFGKSSTGQSASANSTPPATSSGLSFSFTPASTTNTVPTSTNATSTATSKPLFGSTLGASTGNPSGFGSTGGVSFSFGNNQATQSSNSAATPASTGTTLFGGTAQQKPSVPSTSLFGGQTATSSNAPSGASTPQGQRQTSAFSTTPAGNPPQSLFGSNNAQASTQAGTSAATSTTPAVAQSSGFPSFQKNNGNATAPTQEGVFGRPAAAAPSNPGSNLFNPQPASAASSNAAPATSIAASAAPSNNLFGALNNTSSSTATSQPTATQATPSLFGNAAPATTAPSPFGSTAPVASTASGGGNLFGTAGTAQPSATSAPAPANLFGNLGASSSSTPAATTATSASAPRTALFGGPTPSTSTSTSQPNATTASSGGAPPSLFPTTTAPTNNVFGGAASTSGPAPPAQSRLAQKTMDEILTGWSTSLTSHQKTFQSLAKQVSTWDRALVENSTRISQLYGRCFQAERDCSEVERQLSHVEHSQSELEAFLERYEGEVDRLMDQAGFGDGGSGVGGVDAERERTYKMAENCSARLNEMGQSLTSMIDEINDASTKLHSASSNGQTAGRSDDPLQQIVRVLNQHLAQLQTIDNGANALKGRVAAAHREARDLSQSQNLNGSNRALDDFGRSYLGRT